MIPFLINLLLAIAWGAVTGSFALESLLTGFVLGYAALLVARPALGPSPYYLGVWRAIGLGAFFVWELVISSLRVAKDTLSPRMNVQPGIVAVPIEVRTDAEITVLANLISLTPGTLSLDVSADRRTLYIHAMYDADRPEDVRRDVQTKLERRVLRLFRGSAAAPLPAPPSGLPSVTG
ncbi:MAG: Na+/H+ antiporter subunit E [Rubricoccaceae bacterium]